MVWGEYRVYVCLMQLHKHQKDMGDMMQHQNIQGTDTEEAHECMNKQWIDTQAGDRNMVNDVT